MLVLHYTGMTSPAAAIARLCDPAAKVSSHYVIDDDGRVTQLVEEGRRAHHAGISHWRGHDDLNGRSIGIEITNPAMSGATGPFPRGRWLRWRGCVVRSLPGNRSRRGTSSAIVTSRRDRKQDPGELFDWPGLAAQGIGFWPDRPAAPAPDAREALIAIGYPVPDLSTALLAFQRRWLPGRLTGEVCDETCRRLGAVLEAARSLDPD